MQRIAAFALCAALAACSSGPRALPPVASGANSAAKHSAAHFTITVPPKSAQIKARNPKYVSVNTQSVVITLESVNGKPFTGLQAETAVNLTTSSPDCSGTPLVCSISVPAAVGSDAFAVSTYDAQQTSTSPPAPVGNLLSTGTVIVNVVAGQTNAPSTPLVLDGVAASFIATFPSDPHISAMSSGGNPGFAIVGNAPYTLTITPQDASGASIIGPGTPAYNVTSPSTAVTVTAAGSNTFAVQVKNYSANPVNLQVAPQSSSIFTLATSLPIQEIEELWVANYENYANAITAYALASAPYQMTSDSINANGQNIYHAMAVAFDPSGNLWVGYFGSQNILAYSLAGGPAPIASDTIDNGTVPLPGPPTGLAFDAGGDLWAATYNGYVTAYNVPPQVSPPAQIQAYTFAVPPNTATPGVQSMLTSIAFNPSSTLVGQTFWLGNAYNPNVVEYSIPPTGIKNTIAETTSTADNYGLAVDKQGNLWISNESNMSVSEYSQSNTSAPQLAIQTPSGGPTGLAFDGNGNLWVACSVGGINSTGEVVEFNTVGGTVNTSSGVAATITAGINMPYGLAIAP